MGSKGTQWAREWFGEWREAYERCEGVLAECRSGSTLEEVMSEFPPTEGAVRGGRTTFVCGSPALQETMLPHGESVGEMTDRLIRDGGWERFEKFELRVNRSKGKRSIPRDLDAIRIEALEKFAKQEAAEGAAAAETRLSEKQASELMANVESGDSLVLDDAEWVYHSLAIAKVSRGSAPSPGAWGWLTHLRNDPKAQADFYRTVVPKLMPGVGVGGGDGNGKPDDPDEAIVDVVGIDAMIEKVVQDLKSA